VIGFFNVNTVLGSGALSNMPAGFEIGMGDMVPLMGGHAWNFANQPTSASAWEDPVWVMGPYDGSIVSFGLLFFFKIRAVCEYDSTLINSFLDMVHASSFFVYY